MPRLGELLTVLLVCAIPLVGARDGSADAFAQANFSEILYCPSPGIPPYADTGLSVVFDTNDANAVLITATVMVESTRNAGLFIRPTIDGAGFDSDPQVAQSVGSLTDGERRMLSFSRAYTVTPGQHTFGLEWGCHDNVAIVTGGMTVVPLR